MRNLRKLTVPLLVAMLLPSVTMAQNAKPLRFVFVPKSVHEWSDKVYSGAQAAAEMLSKSTGTKVEVEFRPPQTADVVLQNDIIERSIATHPDGILVDLLDEKGNRAVLEEALTQKIPVTLIDSVPPADMPLIATGNDFCEQGKIAANRLVDLLHGEGEVAIMMGVTTAPNHMIRGQCEEEVFKQHPGIGLVAKGIDNDSIETAQKQAAAIMEAHPNLKGWVAVDASGPTGIGQAVKEAGKVGKVTIVGLDNMKDLVQMIKDGVVDSSSSTKPEVQGYWAVIAAWQQTLGAKMPKTIDTGIAVITKSNVNQY
jgi:ribose transport system substrate-binding protein